MTSTKHSQQLKRYLGNLHVLVLVYKSIKSEVDKVILRQLLPIKQRAQQGTPATQADWLLHV